MAEYFEVKNRTWKEIFSGVFISNLHRYQTGGGAALFRLSSGANMPVHDHPTGEHGYLIAGIGIFGDRTLSAGDAFWMDCGESHNIHAITELVFFATSLPKSQLI
jgi:quercetin dioxygenase-like cupin family protein